MTKNPEITNHISPIARFLSSFLDLRRPRVIKSHSFFLCKRKAIGSVLNDFTDKYDISN